VYCGDTCKRRAQRQQRAAKRLDIAPERSETLDSGAEAPLVVSLRSALAEADREASVAGQVALELAVRVANRKELGSSVASLAKQLRETMAEALAGVAQAADPLDEIRARRDAKRNVG